MSGYVDSRIREYKCDFAKNSLDVKELYRGGNAAHGFLRIGKDNAPVLVRLWASPVESDNLKKEAEDITTIGTRFRIALMIAAIATLVLAAIAIAASPILTSPVSAICGYSACLTALTSICLLIATIYHSRRVKPILEQFAHQYARQAQETIYLHWEKVQEDERKDFAEFVAKTYGAAKTDVEARDKCRERAERLFRENKEKMEKDDPELQRKIEHNVRQARLAADQARTPLIQ